MEEEGTFCLICYDTFTDESKCKLLECGHFFCQTCLNLTMIEPNINKKTCPVDRRVIQSVESYDKIIGETVEMSLFSFINDKFKMWTQGVKDAIFILVQTILKANIDLQGLLDDFSIKNFPTNPIDLKDVFTKMKERKDSVIKGIQKTFEDSVFPDHMKNELTKHVGFFVIVDKNDEERRIMMTYFDLMRLISFTFYWSFIMTLYVDEFDKMCYLMENKTNEVSDIDEDFLSRYQILYANITRELSNMNTLAMNVKSILLQIEGPSRTVCFFNNSKDECIMCKTHLASKDHLVFKECRHGICGQCISRFTIVHPQCIFKCIEGNQQYETKVISEDTILLKTMTHYEQNFESEFIDSFRNLYKELIVEYDLLSDVYKRLHKPIEEVLLKLPCAEDQLAEILSLMVADLDLVVDIIRQHLHRNLHIMQLTDKNTMMHFFVKCERFLQRPLFEMTSLSVYSKAYNQVRSFRSRLHHLRVKRDELKHDEKTNFLLQFIRLFNNQSLRMADSVSAQSGFRRHKLTAELNLLAQSLYETMYKFKKVLKYKHALK